MQYGVSIDNSQSYNDSFTKYIGYKTPNDRVERLFSPGNIDTMSRKITELLQGVDPQNRPIIVPNKTIGSVLDAIYSNYRPQTGDIFSRYNIPSETGENSDFQNIVDEVIEIITSDVKNNLGMEEHNRNLTIWTTVLGDFNNHGLMQHPKIKVRNKRPTPMQFNMNY